MAAPWEHDPQFQQFVSTHRHVALPIGTVFIMNFKENVPPMGRRMTIEEGRQFKQALIPLMSEWSIVAFSNGKLDGPGYGCKIMEEYGEECGEGFIVIPGQYN